MRYTLTYTGPDGAVQTQTRESLADLQFNARLMVERFQPKASYLFVGTPRLDSWTIMADDGTKHRITIEREHGRHTTVADPADRQLNGEVHMEFMHRKNYGTGECDHGPSVPSDRYSRLGTPCCHGGHGRHLSYA